jgi:hypothetical protein
MVDLPQCTIIFLVCVFDLLLLVDQFYGAGYAEHPSNLFHKAGVGV